MVSLNKALFVTLILLSLKSYSQYGEVSGSSTFLYRGDDVIEAELNFHNVLYLGIANSFVKIDQNLSLPILFTAYIEYKYLLLDKNERINISISGQGHIGVTSFFLLKLPASINIDFLNMATTQQNYDGIGLSIGGGIEPIVSTFDFHEHSPFVHFSFQFENIRAQYQYRLAQNMIINHCITVGMMLDL